MFPVLQLKHAADSPNVLTSGTLDAIASLQEAGHLREDDAEYLSRSYRFLRSIESGLRLMNTTPRHDLPDDQHQLARLAYLLGYDNDQALLSDCLEYTRGNRQRLVILFSMR